MVGQLERKASAIWPEVRGPPRSRFRMSRRVWSASAANAAWPAAGTFMISNLANYRISRQQGETPVHKIGSLYLVGMGGSGGVVPGGTPCSTAFISIASVA